MNDNYSYVASASLLYIPIPLPFAIQHILLNVSESPIPSCSPIVLALFNKRMPKIHATVLTRTMYVRRLPLADRNGRAMDSTGSIAIHKNQHSPAINAVWIKNARNQPKLLWHDVEDISYKLMVNKAAMIKSQPTRYTTMRDRWERNLRYRQYKRRTIDKQQTEPSEVPSKT